jgi:hypothetical protein
MNVEFLPYLHMQLMFLAGQILATPLDLGFELVYFCRAVSGALMKLCRTLHPHCVACSPEGCRPERDYQPNGKGNYGDIDQCFEERICFEADCDHAVRCHHSQLNGEYYRLGSRLESLTVIECEDRGRDAGPKSQIVL